MLQTYFTNNLLLIIQLRAILTKYIREECAEKYAVKYYECAEKYYSSSYA